MIFFLSGRLMALRKAEKEEEKRAREKIRQKLEEDKVFRLTFSTKYICTFNSWFSVHVLEIPLKVSYLLYFVLFILLLDQSIPVGEFGYTQKTCSYI